MSSTSPSSQLFGLDLAVLWSDFRTTWQRAHRWPLLAWLTPDVPVRVLRADGTEALWDGRRLVGVANALAPRFTAIEVPTDSLLHRSMGLPPMADAQIAQAVALEISTVSPFPAADLVWGHVVQARPEGGLRVDTALASRKQVQGFLDQQHERLKGGDAEVWAFSEAGTPIALAGWGGDHRARSVALRRRIGYGLVLGVLLLVGAMAITPIAQLRLRAIEAAVGYSELQGRAIPVVTQREAFMQTIERMGLLREVLSEQADGIRLLEVLTQVLSDDTSLQSLEVKGLKVRITGLTANAATLMQQLGQQAGFKDVRAPVAAVRNPGATLDSFNIEFQLDPAVWSVAGTGSVQAVASVGAVAPANPAVSAPAVPVPSLVQPAPAATGTPAPAADSASAPRKSRFSSGSEAPRPASIPSKAQP
jgi:general secretion pathway protein L